MRRIFTISAYIMASIILTSSITAFADEYEIVLNESNHDEFLNNEEQNDNDFYITNKKQEIIEVKSISNEDIEDILYSKYGHGQLLEGLFYEYVQETNKLKLFGEGDISNLFDSVADMPWVVFYDQMCGIEIDGEVKIKLWQASKKSAQLSGHLGNYLEVQEKIKNEIINEFNNSQIEQEYTVEDRELAHNLFNKILYTLNISEEELYELKNIRFDDFIFLYKNDMERICSIFNVNTIDELFVDENSMEIDRAEEETEDEIIDNAKDEEIIDNAKDEEIIDAADKEIDYPENEKLIEESNEETEIEIDEEIQSEFTKDSDYNEETNDANKEDCYEEKAE